MSAGGWRDTIVVPVVAGEPAAGVERPGRLVVLFHLEVEAGGALAGGGTGERRGDRRGQAGPTVPGTDLARGQPAPAGRDGDPADGDGASVAPDTGERLERRREQQSPCDRRQFLSPVVVEAEPGLVGLGPQFGMCGGAAARHPGGGRGHHDRGAGPYAPAAVAEEPVDLAVAGAAQR